MFEFWREATATSVPGLLCQSGRRRSENVSILSSLIGRVPTMLETLLWSLRCHHGNDNENVKNAIVWIGKTSTLHVHHSFLYISLPSLNEYDGKMPNFSFYGGRKQAKAKFSFSFWAWI